MWRNNGLSIVLVFLFALTMGGQAVTGWADHNESERQHGGHASGFGRYLTVGTLLGGDRRKLGKRIPPDGGVRPADDVPLSEGIGRVEAHRRD